jgi:exodeoxyribonuclease V alpha subunit
MSLAPTVQRRVAVRDVLSVFGNGAVIFGGVTEDGSALKVVAPARTFARVPSAGEVWTVEGAMRSSERYGVQLHATAGRYELPRGRLLARYLATNPAFQGIGEVKAERLWTTFGDRLAATLSAKDVDALEAVLTRTAAARLCEVWAGKQIEAENIDFLDAHGFDWALAGTLQRAWGDKVLDVLRKNPYHLLAFAGWKRVDSAASKLGVARDDPRRLVGAVEACLYERLQHGHTVTPAATLQAQVGERVGMRAAKQALQLAEEEGAATRAGVDGYQPAGAAALELGIARRIGEMLANVAGPQNELFRVQPALSGWDDGPLAAIERQQGFPLNLEQRAAVKLPFSHRFSLLTGGAGVGKTTVLRAVIDLAQLQHLAVFQMALAGRAAQRMAEATGHEAMTIAKFLAGTRSGAIDVPPASLVVVDEASMLDLPTLYRLLSHLPDGVRLLLVGDPAQLPPIGFGLAFHRLVGNDRVPQTHLRTVHRQAASTGIPGAAAAVRNHTLPVFAPFTGAHVGVSFIECASHEVVKTLRTLACAWAGDDWQALAAVKGGAGGIRAVNASFHADACGDDLGDRFVPGEPVIHLLNDYDRGLMNGALGRVLQVHETGALELEFDGDRYTMPANELPGRIELAYAISVHKAQGSQFKRVAVVVGRSRILDHSMIYTAITRGVEQVVLVGDREALEAAVLAPPLADRRCVAFTV